ncbi:MAG: hypothetical protein J6K37_00555 [Lachnospiraceae bacterium]|nr:hypothetical protein [Lachnospiraceae bacterium]
MVNFFNKEIKLWNINVMDFFVLIIITCMAIYIRVIFIDLQFPDYTICLKPWVESFKEFGGFAGLKYEIGNYTPAYMHILMLISYFNVEPIYLIKSVGIVVDIVLAFVVSALIAKGQSKSKKILVYSIVLMLPTVLANSGIWGQCDNIYTVFILLAWYFALKQVDRKWSIGTDDFVMLFLGCAFSFKLQTIFILPVIAIIFLKHNYRIRTLLWIPIVYCITLIPSWLAGRGVLDLLTIYFRQSQDFQDLQLKFPNVYSFWQFKGMDADISLACILFCGMSLVVFTYYLYNKNFSINVEFICKFTTFSVLFITFFLPHMHDRYAYIAEITSLYYLIDKKKKLWIPILINIIGLESYSETLFWFSFQGFNLVGAIWRIVLIIRVGMDIMEMVSAKKEEKELAM